MLCDNALLFNFPKSHIHIEAKKLKILGSYAFDYFLEFLREPVNIVNICKKDQEIKKMEDEFLKNVEIHYFNILFTSENDPNQNTKIMQRPKPSWKKTDGIPLSKEKELLIEISGMNHVLLEPKEFEIDQLFFLFLILYQE